MSWALVCKVFQKRSFDLLTRKNGVSVILFFLILLTLGLFYIGQVVILWYTSRSSNITGFIPDNLGGRSYHFSLCHKLPIDVVYTWVNGSDPELIKQLNDLKKNMNKHLINDSETPEQACTLSDCIPANGLVIEHDSSSEELIQMFKTGEENPKCFDVSVTSPRISYVLFSSKEELSKAKNLNLSNHDKRVKSVKQLYYTSDGSNSNSRFKEELILTLGLPEMSDDAEPKSFLAKFGNFISDFLMDASSGIAAFYVNDKSTRNQILAEKNFTLSGKTVKFLQGFLVWNLEPISGGDVEITANRFRDTDELRFSLRSLEKFAPWVRHVFIVTNGQVPSWLDLSNPHVTLVTHEEIFQNSSHLPTFSSPAIEAHLHEIPGLSEHFIYLNDDIFFGKEVWPDDFISEDGTQTIYLTYPVPDCKVGCPGSWIRDGYCDKVCNCSECDWDGGDCDPNSTSSIRNQFISHNNNPALFPWSNTMQSMYCNSGCADNWIADRYCDVSCNVYKCGFDAGDCGPENYDKIQRVSLRREQEEYSYLGYSVLHFDLSNLVGHHGHMDGGEFDDDPIVRSFSYVNSSRLLTLVLKSNYSRSSVKGSLNLMTENSAKFVFNFTITLDTSVEEKKVSNPKLETSEAAMTTKPTPPLVLYPSPNPKISRSSLLNVTFDLRNYHLPSRIEGELEKAVANYDKGLLTKKGLMAEEMQILREFFRNSGLEWSESSLTRFFLKSLVLNSRQNAMSVPLTSDMPLKKSDRQAIKMKDGNLSDVHRIGRNLKKFIDHRREDPIESTTLKVTLYQRGFLPWEKKGVFSKTPRNEAEKTIYENKPRKGRHLMDAFADSIRHVNRLYNRAYGYFSRKVPTHSAHFFNKKILSHMRDKFSEEFELTSSSKIRSPEDMQLAFSYYYYLMSEKENKPLAQIFNDFDFDGSGVLSDREIRVLLARIHKLPLFLKELQDLESSLINCSSEYNSKALIVEKAEIYHENRLPQVTLNFLSNCSSVRNLLLSTFSTKDKYKYRMNLDGDSFVSFKMIRNNATVVVKQLDDIRKNMKKFVCLNDDLDDSTNPSGMEDVRSMIRDFYLTFFPRPSQFELKNDQRNEFLTVAEYDAMKNLRTRNFFLVMVILVALVCFIYVTARKFRWKRYLVLKVLHT